MPRCSQSGAQTGGCTPVLITRTTVRRPARASRSVYVPLDQGHDTQWRGRFAAVCDEAPWFCYGPLTVAVVENTSVRLSRLPLLARTWNGLKPGSSPLPAKSRPA